MISYFVLISVATSEDLIFVALVQNRRKNWKVIHSTSTEEAFLTVFYWVMEKNGPFFSSCVCNCLAKVVIN
jgi:hypothetical protein